MKTKKLIWEPKQEEKLVEIIKEKHKNIWNCSDPNFNVLRFRRKAFSEIARELGSEFTSKSVKERWTNIRNTFRHNLRRVESARRENEERDFQQETYEPSWHLWEICQFMVGPECTKRKWNTSDEITLTKVKVENDNSISDEDLFDQRASNDFIITDTNNGPKRVQQRPISLISQAMDTDTSCQKALEEVRSVLKAMKNDPRLDLCIDLKSAEFGKHVASCLSKMNSFNAESARSKILQILSDHNS